MFNPDICLCTGKIGNEKCTECLRYKYYLRDIKDKDKNYNSYFSNPPMKESGECDYYWKS